MDPDDHFMTYATFRKVFKSLPASSAHRAFRSYFERRAGVIGGGGKQKQSDDGPRRATAAEVFGALALAAPVDAGRKVRFLFLLHDRDKDQRLNEVELRIAVASASRGLARLKRNPFPPPDKAVDRVVNGCFGSAEAALNDAGEIGFIGVSAFLNADKGCLRYFQNLEAASFDAGGLYRRQEKLLQQLAQIDGRLGEIDVRVSQAS